MFDATDLEYARREHLAEMGEDSASDAAWSRWTRRVETSLIGLGWDHKILSGPRAGKSCGLDGCEWEDGYSIDFAHDAFRAGLTPFAYIGQVMAKRKALGL